MASTGKIPMAVNACLIGLSGYALSSLDSTEQSYGFALAAFCFIHGLLGFLRSFKRTDPHECNSFHIISQSIMEILPMPMVNIQLYTACAKRSAAWIHGLSVLPFLYDVTTKLNDDCDETLETLKDLTMLGNAGSAVYLSLQEGRAIYSIIGMFSVMMHYGSLAFANLICDTMTNEFLLITNAIIVYLMTLALTGGGSSGGDGGAAGGYDDVQYSSGYDSSSSFDSSGLGEASSSFFDN